MTCKHGYDGNMEASADEQERSSCCGAYVTFSGDGELYCRCCYGLITGGIPVRSVRIDLPLGPKEDS